MNVILNKYESNESKKRFESLIKITKFNKIMELIVKIRNTDLKRSLYCTINGNSYFTLT